MAEYVVDVVAPVLFFLGVAAWFLIIVGSCGAVALVYWLRELWRKR
ncbi:membrane protein [Arthrobacter phage Reedo]|uniref:Membrane protein n=1 Tax=Arthrobacter phage Reedo TaxID=2910755 RepID=A0AA49BN56_9CAUD|nr:membrane protein [Arthrobacter phage Reedo]UJQ86856.1 membrane protein [Arthrobacter phage Reedo]